MPEYVIGVRLDDSRDFVVDPSVLEIAPSISAEFPIGCRVRITSVDKCFPKSDTMAATLLLGKWNAGLKPHDGSVATVLASAPHATDASITVVGVRSEIDGRDFVVDARGLARAPNVSKAFKEGAAVRITTADKVYIKMDGAAKELTLSKWLPDIKPQDGETATVLGSMAHPSEENMEVIGIRTGKGQDFVIAPEGLEAAPADTGKYPVGTRVYIRNVDKLFPKMDDLAKSMHLARWVAGAKPAVPQTPAQPAAEGETEESAAKKRKLGRPLMSCAGEVRGTCSHPGGEGNVVGVRTETGQEFLVAEDGLEPIPNESRQFPSGTRVKINDIGKLYPKWDDKAFQMSLTRWVMGEKPAKVVTGKVMGSVSK